MTTPLGAGASSLAGELARKSFHLLTLGYLGAYLLLGWKASSWALGAWLAVVAAFEHVRLGRPELNRRLFSLFGPLARPGEDRRLSGIYYTSMGCWLAVLLFGRRPQAVEAGVLFLTFGDAAAALVGRTWGRHVFKTGGGAKSLEGSAACLAVCLALALALRLRPAAALIAALAGTVLELGVLPPNDNLWLPLGSAAVVWGLS